MQLSRIFYTQICDKQGWQDRQTPDVVSGFLDPCRYFPLYVFPAILDTTKLQAEVGNNLFYLAICVTFF